MWSAELHEGKVCRNLILGQCVKCFRFFPTLKFYQTFLLCGLVPPTLALTFLLREKSAKAYPRGHLLLDISSGGRYPPQSLRDVPPLMHQTFVKKDTAGVGCRSPHQQRTLPPTFCGAAPAAATFRNGTSGRQKRRLRSCWRSSRSILLSCQCQ